MDVADCKYGIYYSINVEYDKEQVDALRHLSLRAAYVSRSKMLHLLSSNQYRLTIDCVFTVEELQNLTVTGPSCMVNGDNTVCPPGGRRILCIESRRLYTR